MLNTGGSLADKSDMPEQQDHPWPFLLLCLEDRQALYRPVLEQVPAKVHFVATPEELLRCCMLRPPLAALGDFLSLAKLGADAISPLLNLKVFWPFIRCNINPEGKSMAMSQDPPRREVLQDVLRQIASGDISWNSPIYQRRHLRIELRCRVKLFQVDGEPILSNTINLGTQGIFVLSYQPFPVKTQLEMKLFDLDADVLHLTCAVVQVREWAAGPHLPGMGLRIIDGQVQRYVELLSSPSVIQRFRTSVI